MTSERCLRVCADTQIGLPAAIKADPTTLITRQSSATRMPGLSAWLLANPPPGLSRPEGPYRRAENAKTGRHDPPLLSYEWPSRRKRPFIPALQQRTLVDRETALRAWVGQGQGPSKKSWLRSSGKYGILRPKPDVAARTHNGRTVWMSRPEPAYAMLYKTRVGRYDRHRDATSPRS